MEEMKLTDAEATVHDNLDLVPFTDPKLTQVPTDFDFELENVSLEYDYLTSAEKLLEYQTLYFEEELIQKNIKKIKVYNISDSTNKIQDFKIIRE